MTYDRVADVSRYYRFWFRHERISQVTAFERKVTTIRWADVGRYYRFWFRQRISQHPAFEISYDRVACVGRYYRFWFRTSIPMSSFSNNDIHYSFGAICKPWHSGHSSTRHPSTWYKVRISIYSTYLAYFGLMSLWSPHSSAHTMQWSCCWSFSCL